MSSKPRIGIVGAGGIFDAHARAYQELGVPIAAVADVDRQRAEQAAARYQIPAVCTDWRELLDAKVDVVDVCTPPKHHTAVVVEALRAGKHVVCEKPLAATLAEADQIAKAAEASSSKMTVVHQLRFHPQYQRLKWLVAGGHLGKVCQAQMHHHSPPPRNLVDQGKWGVWSQTGGGVVMTKAIHQLDLLLWLLGDAKRVHAVAGTTFYPIESEDNAVVQIEFEQGALASLCISGAPHGLYDGLRLVGVRGMASFPFDLQMQDGAARGKALAELDAKYPLPGKFRKQLRDLGVKLRLVPWKSETQIDHRPFLQAFLDAVGGQGEVPVTVQEARRATELCTAIYTSVLTGQPVELPLTSSARYYEGIPKDEYHGSFAVPRPAGA